MTLSFRALAKKIFFAVFLAGFLLAMVGITATATTWLYIKYIVQGKEVVVPDLYGLTVDEARLLTQERGLILAIDEEHKVPSILDKGRVYLQVPRSNRVIKANRVIEITLSAGPEKKLIPSLVGKTLNFSNTLLKDEATEVAIVSRSPDEKVLKGRILEQSPETGSEISGNLGVSLLISDGPQQTWYVTPNLVGKDYITAKAFLDEHQFRVLTKYRSGEEDSSQTILDQRPPAGYPMILSQTITLVVNKDF